MDNNMTKPSYQQGNNTKKGIVNKQTLGGFAAGAAAVGAVWGIIKGVKALKNRRDAKKESKPEEKK